MNKIDRVWFMTVLIAALLGVFFIFATKAHADAHHLTCGNFNGGSASCSAGVLTFTGSGDGKYNNGLGIIFSPGTYYFSFTAVGTGTGEEGVFGDTTFTTNPFSNGTVIDDPVTVPPGDSSWNSYVWGDSGSFMGTVSDMCWSDSAGECEAAPPGPEASTTNATTTYIQNPNQDLFNGILIFFLAAAFVVWTFKRV